jgi:hypothetical protein
MFKQDELRVTLTGAPDLVGNDVLNGLLGLLPVTVVLPKPPPDKIVWSLLSLPTVCDNNWALTETSPGAHMSEIREGYT